MQFSSNLGKVTYLIKYLKSLVVLIVNWFNCWSPLVPGNQFHSKQKSREALCLSRTVYLKAGDCFQRSLFCTQPAGFHRKQFLRNQLEALIGKVMRWLMICGLVLTDLLSPSPVLLPFGGNLICEDTLNWILLLVAMAVHIGKDLIEVICTFNFSNFVRIVLFCIA